MAGIKRLALLLTSQELLQALHDDLVILFLGKAAHHNGRDRPLHSLDAHREAAAVDGIIARRLAQLEPRLEQVLVAHLEQIMGRPRAPSEPENGVPLSLHPVVVLGNGAGSRCGVEEELVVVGERDVDHGGLLGYFSESVADQDADLKGIFGSEVRQDEGLLLLNNLGKLVQMSAYSE